MNMNKCGCDNVGDEFGHLFVEHCPLHEAAPEMLAALEAIRDRVETYGNLTEKHNAISSLARAALALAKGETE